MYRKMCMSLLSTVVVHSAPALDHGGKSLDFGNFQIPKRDEIGISGKNLIVNGNFELENEKSAGPKKIISMPGSWQISSRSARGSGSSICTITKRSSFAVFM